MTKYVAIIVKTGNGYAAHLPDLPGCIAAGDTFQKTEGLILQAAIYHVELMAEHGESIPEPRSIAIDVEVPTLDVSQQVAVETGG